MPVLHGSCLCGGVKFEIDGPLHGASNCHCSMCRKQHGAAFRSRARVAKADFKWIQGEELVTFYESSPGGFRGFCRVCGSPIINKFSAGTPVSERDPDAPSRYGIALATLVDDPGVRPAAHAFVAFWHPGMRLPTICRNTRKASGGNQTFDSEQRDSTSWDNLLRPRRSAWVAGISPAISG